MRWNSKTKKLWIIAGVAASVLTLVSFLNVLCDENIVFSESGYHFIHEKRVIDSDKVEKFIYLLEELEDNDFGYKYSFGSTAGGVFVTPVSTGYLIQFQPIILHAKKSISLSERMRPNLFAFVEIDFEKLSEFRYELKKAR